MKLLRLLAWHPAVGLGGTVVVAITATLATGCAGKPEPAPLATFAPSLSIYSTNLTPDGGVGSSAEIYLFDTSPSATSCSQLISLDAQGVAFSGLEMLIALDASGGSALAPSAYAIGPDEAGQTGAFLYTFLATGGTFPIANAVGGQVTVTSITPASISGSLDAQMQLLELDGGSIDAGPLHLTFDAPYCNFSS